MRPVDEHAARRREMVSLIASRGVRDAAVLDVMSRLPRHELVPPELVEYAYDDRPLPIGYGQTISQPFIVAYMSEAARVTPGARVLDVGTGSGYQTAVLAELSAEVYSIEIDAELARRAAENLQRLGIRVAGLRVGDGTLGWPEAAPFDAILVAAAANEVPRALLDQLAPGGRLIIPVGPPDDQVLELHERRADHIERRRLLPVRFVPMTGEGRETFH